MRRAIVLAVWLAGSTMALAQAAPVGVDAATSAPAPTAAAAPTPAASAPAPAPTAPAAQSPADPAAAPAPSSQPVPLLSPSANAAAPTADDGTLSVQQQDNVRAAILGQSVTALSNTDLDATVGAAVPDGVALHDLPAGSDAPGLSGLKFVVLTDGRIVFVDPATRQIRAVLG